MDIKNTAGRVTARLKQAGYRIFYVFVLASYETSMSRIRDRFVKTGRDVPAPMVQSLFKSLQESVPVYLRRQSSLAEAMLLYDNSVDGEVATPVILSGGRDPTQAIDYA